ncbi:MAG: chromosome partitioning protein ParA [Cellulomonas sp. 73-145]|uniref:ParA family protein n=1 Tax=Cellulomonas sp. 73-145 TaxID=1895739 RepID=UPI0009259396|nr:ParA family protein [Cellulomonas sp. 73-145]MBN9325491.1 ParA family protein [Cellulomonas sp.]OJV57566.1 MAG: chromosome partitioning protein ParA [Cellulomonas sp. 73-145]
MLVLGVCSLKGGVGKTSVTLGLASAALDRGLSTLVVDLDPQGDSTMSLAVDRPSGDVSTVLDDPRAETVTAATGPSGWADGGLDVLVGSERTVLHDRVDDSDLDRLRYALSWVTGYDLVLVDCPPSLGGLTRTGLTACDRAIVVTEPGLFSVMAVGRAMRTIDELRRGAAPALQPLGIVVNRVRARSVEQTYRLGELQTLYGPLLLSPTVPERAALQQAQGAAQPVHAWPGAAAAEVAGVFDALLDRALRAPRPH